MATKGLSEVYMTSLRKVVAQKDMQQMSMTHGYCVYKHLSYGRIQMVLTINSDQRREMVLTPILTLRSICTRNRRSDCL